MMSVYAIYILKINNIQNSAKNRGSNLTKIMFNNIQFFITKFKFNTIKAIEKEIVENQKRLNEIEHTLREEYSEPDAFTLTHEVIEIEKYNKILDLKRRHKLDEKDGWVSKFIWVILAQIIVAVSIYLLINILT